MIIETHVDEIGININELSTKCAEFYSDSVIIKKKTATFTRENLNQYLIDLVEKLESKYKINKSNNFKLRAVRIEKNDTIKNNITRLNNPHIDYNRNKKVMIYLNDVSEENGAFNIYDCDPDSYENFRNNLQLHEGANYIKNLDKKNFKSIIGEKGKMVIFDTNCPHFQGKFKNEKCIRFNIRIDWENSKWRYPKKLYWWKFFKDLENIILRFIKKFKLNKNN